MTLSKDDIYDELEDRHGNLGIERYKGPLHVGPSSVDLHLYPELKAPYRPPTWQMPTGDPEWDNGLNPESFDVETHRNRVRVDVEESYPEWYSKDELVVEPGEFVLATTEEKIALGNELVGYVQGRSSVGRLGLQVENAGLIDAGFEGQVTLELKNQAGYEIELVDDMRIAQISFHRHENAPDVGYSNQGKYQGQEGPTPSRLYEDFQ